MPSSQPGVLERSAAILNSFSTARMTLTLSEIERLSGLPRSTAHRLATQLTEVGLLQRTLEGYTIGDQVFEWAQLVPHARVTRTARPYLQDVYGASHRVVHMAIRQGYSALYIEKMQAHGRVITPTRIGARLPLHSTGVGKVFLAFESGDLIRAICAEGLERFTSATLTSERELRQEVSVIKAQGYATDNAENHPSTRCVAAPVFQNGNKVVAAVSLLLAEGDSPEPLARLVKLACRGISRELGAT